MNKKTIMKGIVTKLKKRVKKQFPESSFWKNETSMKVNEGFMCITYTDFESMIKFTAYYRPGKKTKWKQIRLDFYKNSLKTRNGLC